MWKDISRTGQHDTSPGLQHSRTLTPPIGDNRVILVTGEQGSGKTATLQALLAGLPEGTPVQGIVNEAAGSSTDMDAGALRGALSSASIVGVPGWICCRDSAEVLNTVREHRAALKAGNHAGITVIEQSGYLPVAPVASLLQAAGFYPYVISTVRHDQLQFLGASALSRYAIPNLRLAHAVVVTGVSESDIGSQAVRDVLKTLRQGTSFEPNVVFRPSAVEAFSPQL